jgi:acetamidase/formamidase
MAQRHVFEPKKYYFAYGPHDPVLTLRPGDRLVTVTADALCCDAEGRKLRRSQKHLIDGSSIHQANPLTGPFCVEGAEIGDTLAVHVERIQLNRNYGISRLNPGFGCLAVEDIPPRGFGPMGLSRPMPKRTFRWRIDPARKIGTLDLPASRLKRVRIPLAPFLGCIGTAPNLGETLSSMSPGQHGGNMDCVETRQGATVYLPVYARGAYLAFGDVHAAQGDGEICGVAIETTAEVTLRVDLIKNKPIDWPRIEDRSHIMVAASTRPLIDAFKIAHTDMVRWLAVDYGFDTWEAYQLLSQLGTARVGNVVDPKFTVVAKFPKKYLP